MTFSAVDAGFEWPPGIFRGCQDDDDEDHDDDHDDDDDDDDDDDKWREHLTHDLPHADTLHVLATARNDIPVVELVCVEGRMGPVLGEDGYHVKMGVEHDGLERWLAAHHRDDHDGFPWVALRRECSVV